MSEEDKELEMLRQKRLAELQSSRRDDEMVEREREKIEEQKNQILIRIMTRDAKERLNRLRMAYPEMAGLVENQLIMLYRAGRLPGEIDDETLKKLLAKLQPKSIDYNIVRK
ncbi:MAG: DNA-binding protein [Thermoplasmatota archaeon]